MGPRVGPGSAWLACVLPFDAGMDTALLPLTGWLVMLWGASTYQKAHPLPGVFRSPYMGGVLSPWTEFQDAMASESSQMQGKV